jgi:hypothetical protein
MSFVKLTQYLHLHLEGYNITGGKREEEGEKRKSTQYLYLHLEGYNITGGKREEESINVE